MATVLLQREGGGVTDDDVCTTTADFLRSDYREAESFNVQWYYQFKGECQHAYLLDVLLTRNGLHKMLQLIISL